MTDSTGWVSPGDPAPRGPEVPTPLPVTPKFGGPGMSTPGWMPPPRPGLIPLAPMTLGTILGGSLRVLRRNPRPVVGFSLVIHAVVALITITTTGLFTIGALTSYFNSIGAGHVSGSTITSLLLAEVGAVVGGAFTIGGEAILQGIITVEVSRGTVGERLPLRALWARARGRILVLVGWAAAEIGVLLGVALVVIGIVVALTVAFGSAGAIIGGVIAVLAVIAIIVIGIWVGIKLSLVPSVLVLERLTLGKAIRRSWSLVHGFFWRTLGIELLVALMLGIASSIVTTPVAVVFAILIALSHPTGSSTASLAGIVGIEQVVTTVVSALVSTITAIVSTAVTALIYIDLRIRKEGLDLDLMRFADARQAGNAGAPDPYAAPPAA